MTRAWTTSRKSWPVTRSSSSASTQWADDGWYSKRVPGSQFSRQRAKAAHRPSLVSPTRDEQRRVREAGRVEHHLLDGDDVLAVGGELGDQLGDPAGDGSSSPSPISAHMAPATRAFVAE